MADDPNETFLYLTTTGRKSGNPHRIEIWYVERAGRYYMVSEHPDRADWVKNVQAKPAVLFSVGTRADNGAVVAERTAAARLVDAAAEPELASAVAGLMQAKYDWSDGQIVELA